MPGTGVDSPIGRGRAPGLAACGRIGLFSRDLRSGQAHWDPSLFEMTGLDLARGAPDWDTFLAHVEVDDRVGLQRRFAALSGQPPQRGELHFRFRRPDGRTCWLHALYEVHADADGAALRVTGVMVDDHRAGRLLEAGERACDPPGVVPHSDAGDGDGARAEFLADRSRLVAQAMGVGFWQSEADGSDLHWDAQMYRLHGRDPSLPPLPFDDWLGHGVPPDARDEARSRLRADHAQWLPETVLTVPVRAGGGELRWIRTWTRRLEHGGHRRLMGMHQDVTEQCRLEALQAEAERAERASREKSAFMSSMSHHLRTPLNAVLGFTQLLLQDSVEPPSVRQRDWLSRIDAAGQELLGMLDEVFELATLEPSVAEPGSVTFDAVAARLSDAVRPLAKQRHVELVWRGVPPAGLHLSTDPALLGQALQHLLAHSVRRSERGDGIELAFGSADGFAWLDLRGSGPRLDALQRELWFDPAAPGSPAAAAEGEPMGLDLVRQALERLGVRLEWRDDAGGRTGLRVSIPLVVQAPGPGADALPTMSLLCIEDNPVNMLLVRELVARRPGFGFRGAEDGAAGLALAFEAPPDVVLLDLNLPDMNGREVLDRLRADARTAQCRIIALSAGALPEDILGARKHGFDDYWTKPIDFDRFLAGLDALAAGRRA